MLDAKATVDDAGRVDAPRPRRRAARGFALDGTLRYELLAGADTGYVQVAGRYAYVGSGNSTRFASSTSLPGESSAWPHGQADHLLQP